MKNPLKIGITGGIGSGKTTVTQLFTRLGIPVYASDDRAKWLMNNDAGIVRRVKQLFGEASYTSGGLNRAHISAMAFGNKELITELNHTVHPAVFADFDRWVKKQHASPYILKEAALLFESGSYLTLDAMIVVDAPLELRISRVMKRDSAKREAVLARIGNQMPDDVRTNAADFVVTNDGDPLLPQVLQLHHLWS